MDMNKPETAASNLRRDETYSTDRPASAANAVGEASQAVGGDDSEDARWVELAVNGDGQAFEKLFVKHRQRLFGVAWRLLRDEDKALDVVQDAFVKAFEQLSQALGEFFGDKAKTNPPIVPIKFRKSDLPLWPNSLGTYLKVTPPDLID